MSTVSIIIPCHKEGELLREAVNSALLQSHPHTEVVIVADGVRDRATLQVLEDFETHNRVQVVRTEQGGVSAARNRGLATARGDYVIFLDGDDLLHPDFASLGVATFHADPAALIVGARP